MNNARLRQQIDAASAYEDLFVPALFEQWTSRIAESAGVGPGQRVLDVACGTGVLSREVARRVGDDGHAAGLDLLPGMLEVARRFAPDIEWRQGSAEALPYPDESFDAVVSQFGMMFFPDPGKALREMLRVLMPGGRFAIAVWAAINAMPAYAEEVALLERMAGGAPPTRCAHRSRSARAQDYTRSRVRPAPVTSPSKPVPAWRIFRASGRLSRPTCGAGFQ